MKFPKVKKLEPLKHVKHDLNIDDVVILPKNTPVFLQNLRCVTKFDKDIALKVKTFIIGDSKYFFGLAGEIIIFNREPLSPFRINVAYHFTDIEISASSDDVISKEQFEKDIQ